jgi:hypothetical protein
MTSYTRKLFSRDPGAAKAAEDFARTSKFDRQQDMTRKAGLASLVPELRYGKVPTLACFHEDRALIERTFGRRQSLPARACPTNCGHPACFEGCTLHNRAPQGAQGQGGR